MSIAIPEKTIEVVISNIYTFDGFYIRSINPNENGISVSVSLTKKTDTIDAYATTVYIKDFQVESQIYQSFTPSDLVEYIKQQILLL